MARKTGDQALINNAFYDELGSMWYEGDAHPVGLLRAENRIRIPWILDKIEKHFNQPIQAIDLGCGGGFLTHALAKSGHEVTGIDLSKTSLEIAKEYDSTGQVEYLHADALKTPFPDASFDMVCAMDILEHVEKPEKLIQEAARLLRKNGLFFFHTFNRTFLSYLLVIKGVEWTLSQTPKNMHILRLFIKPKELKQMCRTQGLETQEVIGFAPKIFQYPLLRLLFRGSVSADFQFQFTKSLKTGYIGYSRQP